MGRPFRAPAVPSNVYGKRQFKTGRVTVSEKYAASFFPRVGFVRIDESLPNLEAALTALLNPIYFALRKPRRTPIEVEINIRVKGQLTISPTAHEKLRAEWKSKEELWRNDERLTKG
jgi:hypothetical protein